METGDTFFVSVYSVESMTGDSQVQQRILEKAEELFLKFGVSKVTVDEIAAELGMSKKTLYKYFASKEAMLVTVMNSRRERIKGGIQRIIQSKDVDFIEKIAGLLTFIGSQFAQATPQFIIDLRKSAPHVCGALEEDRNQYALEAFKTLGAEGISKGYFRDDIDLDFLALMYVTLVQGIMHSDVVARLPLTAGQVFRSILDVMFFGMFTDKGREQMQRFRQAERA